MAVGARLHQLRQDRLAKVVERYLVAKKERLVRGHGFDHFRDHPLGTGLHLRDQLGDAGQPRASRQRYQSAFDEILLVQRQVQTGALFQQPAQILVIDRRHARSPENNRTSLGAICSSGSTAAQIPAWAAAPGIPHTTLEASSWAMTLPPAATISLPPWVPSEPMPVSTRARTPARQTSMAEVNNGSTAGLQKLIGAPSSSAITVSVPWRATRMWRPPGAT